MMTYTARDREYFENLDSETVVRCRAFGGPLQAHRVSLDHDGEVRVWDSVAQHYTRRAGLSRSQCQRIRAQIRAARTAARTA